MQRSPGRSGRPWQRLRQRVIDTSDGRCHICGLPVNRSLPGTHPDGPTIDHLVALVDGGHPTDPANLRLAHRRCNGDKEADRRTGTPLNTSRRW